MFEAFLNNFDRGEFLKIFGAATKSMQEVQNLEELTALQNERSATITSPDGDRVEEAKRLQGKMRRDLRAYANAQ